MSYVALATDRFDQMTHFYGDLLGFPVVEQWDRPNGRGRRFNLGGMRLEILDNQRERCPLSLGEAADRFHVVVEVEDIEQARTRIKIQAPPAQPVSWGAILFQIRDPDGVPVTFLQWSKSLNPKSQSLRGRLTTGMGRGAYFTRLDWARHQFVEKLGIDPFPGTLNLKVEDPESKAAWNWLKSAPGVVIDNPQQGPHDCNARCFPVSIKGLDHAAIVLPEIKGYPENQVEIIAAIGIRNALGINDGDSLVLEIAKDIKTSSL